jgi:hypothetical protein
MHMRRLRALCLSIALALPSVTPMSRSEAADARALEYAVKANFLYKFGDYVTWPPGGLGEADAAVNLCVVGDDPFAGVLDDAVAGERIAGRPITVLRLQVASPDTLCHIVFTRGSARQSTTDVLAVFAGRPVLTITEASNFGAGGGIIHFILRDNRVRFEIDQKTAGDSGLGISSKLLQLAVAVYGSGGAK